MPDVVSNHQPHDCLLSRLFRRRSKKTSKLRVTGLYAGIHRWQVSSPHKWPVTRKMLPFDDVIMRYVTPKENITQNMIPWWNAIECHSKYRRVICCNSFWTFKQYIGINLTFLLFLTCFKTTISFYWFYYDLLFTIARMFPIVDDCHSVLLLQSKFNPNKIICNFMQLGE